MTKKEIEAELEKNRDEQFNLERRRKELVNELNGMNFPELANDLGRCFVCYNANGQDPTYYRIIGATPRQYIAEISEFWDDLMYLRVCEGHLNCLPNGEEITPEKFKEDRDELIKVVLFKLQKVLSESKKAREETSV